MYSKFELMEKAASLGAVGYRIFFIVGRRESYDFRDEFSFHFFDANDEEVCYFMKDTFRLLGLTTFEKPRKWSTEFKTHENYSALMKLDCNF